MSAVDAAGSAGRARFAIVASRFNDLIVARLEHGARDVLVRSGTDANLIDTVWVPGAWEIPLVAAAIARRGEHIAIVAVGAVIRGATYHFEIVANQSAAGLARVALDHDIVVTNGIITVDTMEQALDRAGGKVGNKGADAASAALDTVRLLGTLAGPR